MIRGGTVRRELTDIAELKHDPEKWKLALRKDHASPKKMERPINSICVAL
jgi:hypothetical protein